MRLSKQLPQQTRLLVQLHKLQRLLQPITRNTQIRVRLRTMRRHNPLLLRQRMIQLVTLTQLDNARGSLRTLCHGLVTTGVTLLVGAPQLRQQVV